jgi:hypothetical protein
MLPCPCCGVQEASIEVKLYDLDGDAFRCCECSAEFSVACVRDLIRRWTKLLAWVETAPAFGEGE